MATTFNLIGEEDTSIDDAALVRRTLTWRGMNTSAQVSDVTVIDDFSTATGIRRYSIYTGADGRTDPTCRASALTAKRTDNIFEWLVTVPFTSMRATALPRLSPRQQRERAAMARENQQSGQQPPADPTERPPVLRIGSQEYEEVMLHDAIELIDGEPKPVWNAARSRPVPPPTKPRTFRVITLEKNEPLFSEDFTHGFENTVNEKAWRGYAAKTVLCKSITADADFEGRWDFWRVTYVFHVNKEGWMYKMLNEGPTYLDANGKITRFRDETTSGGLGEVRPLKLDGTPLEAGGKPVYLEFNRFTKRDFSLLGLGT